MNTKLLLIVLLLAFVLIILGIKLLTPREPAVAPASDEKSILQEVETIDLGSLDSEFQNIDQDLNTL